MQVSNHVVAAAAKVPAYCNSGLFNLKVLSPSQWTACAKAGLNEPASTAATTAGHATGTSLILVVAAVIVVLLVVRARRRTTVRGASS
jgi:hypothetical protein